MNKEQKEPPLFPELDPETIKEKRFREMEKLFEEKRASQPVNEEKHSHERPLRDAGRAAAGELAHSDEEE